MSARPALLLAATLAVGACHRDIDLLSRDASDGVGPNDTGTNPLCSGLGDPIQLPTAAGQTCAAALATRGHRYVLCSCESMTAPARVRSDAFDSRDATVFDEVAAAFGIDGDLIAIAEMRAGGAFHVAGPGGIRASTQFRSERSLQVGGPFTMLSFDNADVGTDAFVDGNVVGRLRVTGTLHVPPGAALTPDVEYSVLVNSEPVTVRPPCDCSAGFANVAAAIAAAAASNHDSAFGLPTTRLADVTTATTVSLPCGIFYLDDIDADAEITIAVHGRALLAVGGDVTTRAGFTVQLDPSAELDLLVGGQLISSGGGTFGAAGAAARFRVWIAGTVTNIFDDAPAVSAVIHAPTAAVTAPAGLPMSGSLLARSVSIGADSTLHFDRAILAAGAVCGEPEAAVVP